jgi:hypothetical protein
MLCKGFVRTIHRLASPIISSLENIKQKCTIMIFAKIAVFLMAMTVLQASRLDSPSEVSDSGVVWTCCVVVIVVDIVVVVIMVVAVVVVIIVVVVVVIIVVAALFKVSASNLIASRPTCSMVATNSRLPPLTHQFCHFSAGRWTPHPAWPSG